MWENTMVKIPLKSKADENILAIIEKHIVKEKTQNANLLFQAANYYYSTNRDSMKAIQWLNEAEKIDGTNFSYPNLRQKIYVDLKDFPNAILAAKTALAIAENKKMKVAVSLKKQIEEWELLLKNKK
jgi:tetratricopeptide (TPR) repeat protein